MAAHDNAIEVSCKLSRPLPVGTIDTHMHIIPPDFDKYPLLPTAQYKPTSHTISDAINFYQQHSGLGIAKPRMVLTQVSIYGTDNSALLSGIDELQGRGCGVIECDPVNVSVSQLALWWQQGVRGVRINLVSIGRTLMQEELQQTLQAYVDRLVQHQLPDKTKKWVVEMYLPLKMQSLLLKVIPNITNGGSVRWCLDHFGGLKWADDAPEFRPEGNPYLIKGFRQLVELVTNQDLPEVFVKLSAAYRMDPDYPSPDALSRLNVVGRELVTRAENRVMWASDWPHTRFENVNSIPFVEACYNWCGEGAEGDARREKLFRTNAERLWDMSESADEEQKQI